jgi:membrane-associated protein
MQDLIDLFLHLDVHLEEFIGRHGPSVYGLLFAIVFAETGLVVTPFLPGDSLLFAAGALAATGKLDIRLVLLLLAAAAIVGNMVNYSVGRYIGPRVFRADATPGRLNRLLNREHLDRAHAFFERHGGMAIVLTRFVPIIRTFVPGESCGWGSASARATRSGTCRSSRTTSPWWRSGLSRCRWYRCWSSG